jgi:hypothetical protein
MLWKRSYNPYYMPGCNMHVKWLKIEQKKESLLNVILAQPCILLRLAQALINMSEHVQSKGLCPN